MTAGSDGASAVAGGLARHIPVLGRPAIEFLNVREGGVYVDATFGGGGYSGAILAAADCTVIAVDRDRQAIAAGAGLAEAAGGRLRLIEARFSNLATVVERCGHTAVDGVVFDLGVSSMQLDAAERGFSFRQDAELDMRMGSAGPTAADVLACASERDLAAIIATLGEERHARAIARAVVAARRQAPIRTTRALADLVARIGSRGREASRIHPATRTFQALRMLVNEEIEELAEGLSAAEQLLKERGRLVVVAFHSLEDRLVKQFLAQRSRPEGSSRHAPPAHRPAAAFRLLTRRPIVPDAAEVAANPRSRSAKLRAAERTDAAPLRAPRDLPPIPSLAEVLGSAGKPRRGRRP